MIKIYIFIILSTTVFAANLLTYNIYERSDRIDIMLSFDSPYEGRIYQKNSADKIVLTLEDLSYDKNVKKSINSNIIQNMEIKPEKNLLKVILSTKNKIAVIASKTTDGFGLRIRSKLINHSNNKYTQKPSNSSYLTNKQEQIDYIDQRYIIVVIFLFILFLGMFWIKKRIANKNNSSNTQKGSWLFKKELDKNIDIKILHKKPVDQHNSLILIEFEGRKYLLMAGNSNVLIDTFSTHELKTDSEFEKVFEDNRKKLDDYLKLQDQKVKKYKDRVSL